MSYIFDEKKQGFEVIAVRCDASSTRYVGSVKGPLGMEVILFKLLLTYIMVILDIQIVQVRKHIKLF